MRSFMRSGLASVSAVIGLGLGIGIAGAPGEAAAVGITLPFGIEVGPQRTGDFGTLEIEEVGNGDLRFTIVLNTAVLGSKADLHEFYFNLSGGFDDDAHERSGKKNKHDDDWDDDDDRDDDDWDDDELSISGFRCNGGSCKEPFELEDDEPTRGGAGARFDFTVEFGDGSGKKGNGALQIVSFLLGGDEDLTLADVLGETSSTGRGLELLFAAHVTGSGNGHGSASATIGVDPAAVPEPGTALLLGLGLAGLARLGRRPGG